MSCKLDGHGVCAVGVSVLLALCVPSIAGATQPSKLPAGVHLDPTSPAAKEYAIPLGQARGGGHAGGSGSTQLFGRGITPVNARPTTTARSGPRAVRPRSRSRSSVAKRAAGHKARPHRGASSAAVPPQSKSAERVLGKAGSADGYAWMLGIAAIVLVVGGLVGAALARRGRRSNPLVN